MQHVKNFLEPRDQTLRRKMQKNLPHLLVAVSLTLRDNARKRIAVVVTKNFAIMGVTSCALKSRLRLIPKVIGTYACTTFSSLEDLSTDGTRAIRHMNESDVLDGIIMLPKRWDSVIEIQGNYIEGL